MSQGEYYSDIKILKKPLKDRVKSAFKIFLFFLVVGTCLFGAKYLSKALTVGNIGALIVYGDTVYKTEGKSYYAVTMGEYDNFNDAEEVALGATVQGAAGYVWEELGSYYVIGNVYSREEDALSVVDNLKETKYTVGIKEIKLTPVKIDFSMYENKDMGVVKKSFDIINKVYDSIYKHSLDFDKGEVTNLAVSSYISQLRGEVKGIIVEAQNLLNKNSSSLKKVQSTLIKIDELLDQTIIKVIDNSSTNYSLKYTICSVVRLQYELFYSLNE